MSGTLNHHNVPDATLVQIYLKTLKKKTVGAISKAQNAQKTFFKTKLEIFDFFSENVA